MKEARWGFGNNTAAGFSAQGSAPARGPCRGRRTGALGGGVGARIPGQRAHFKPSVSNREVIVASQC